MTSSAAIVNMTLLFIETTLAARLVTTDAFGFYVLVVAVVNFFMMAVDFGAKTAVTQLIARDDGPGRTRIVNSAIAFRIIVIGCIWVCLVLSRDLLAPLDWARDVMPYLGQVPLMVLVASMDQLLFGMLQGFHAYGPLATAQIIRSILRLVLTMLFLGPLGLGVEGLLYSWTLSFGASAAYQYWALPVAKRWSFERVTLAELLRFGAPLQFAGFLWFIFGRIQTFILGAWSGPSSVAYFAVAARIPEALQQVAESYMAVYFPRMTALLAGGQRADASRMLDASLRLVSFGAAALALGGVLLSEAIIELLFSSRYAASAPAFSVLMVALHMILVVNLLGYTLTSAGHPQRSLVVRCCQDRRPRSRLTSADPCFRLHGRWIRTAHVQLCGKPGCPTASASQRAVADGRALSQADGNSAAVRGCGSLGRTLCRETLNRRRLCGFECFCGHSVQLRPGSPASSGDARRDRHSATCADTQVWTAGARLRQSNPPNTMIHAGLDR